MHRLVFALGLLLFALQAPAQERRLPVLSANLDALLNFAQLWQWSSEDFEKAYVVKLADPEQQEKPPQFEWVNATKERARFSLFCMFFCIFG
jgi:hypothetical protein